MIRIGRPPMKRDVYKCVSYCRKMKRNLDDIVTILGRKDGRWGAKVVHLSAPAYLGNLRLKKQIEKLPAAAAAHLLIFLFMFTWLKVLCFIREINFWCRVHFNQLEISHWLNSIYSIFPGFQYFVVWCIKCSQQYVFYLNWKKCVHTCILF